MKKVIYIIFVLFAFGLNGVFANDIIDLSLEKCVSENYMTEGMNNCAKIGIDSRDKEINKYTLEIKNKLSPKDIKLFEKSQNSWNKYYLSEQKFLLETLYNEVGDIHTTYVYGYLYNLKKSRAMYLKQLLDNI